MSVFLSDYSMIIERIHEFNLPNYKEPLDGEPGSDDSGDDRMD
jgi:hypothetical protein